MEPMLFVTIGSSIDFSTLSTGTIPKSLLIIGTGVALRMICTFFVMAGFGYNTKEKLFYSIAWTPKATVQAALSGERLPAVGSSPREKGCGRPPPLRAEPPPPAPPCSRAADDDHGLQGERAQL